MSACNRVQKQIGYQQLQLPHEIQKELRCVGSNDAGSFYKFLNMRLSCKSGVGRILHGNDGKNVTNAA